MKSRPAFAGGSRLLWEGALISGFSTGLPARASTALTGAAYFVGSWNFLNIATWGGGIELEVNPYATGNFQAGIVGMRAMLTADVGLTWPAAFNFASTVT